MASYDVPLQHLLVVGFLLQFVIRYDHDAVVFDLLLSEMINIEHSTVEVLIYFAFAISTGQDLHEKIF